MHKRPVHCTDLKKQTLYIKEDGAWSKDNQEDKMTKLIRGVDCEQCKSIKGGGVRPIRDVESEVAWRRLGYLWCGI